MSPECSNYEALLSASLDGELTPAEASACAEHLEVCDRCRARYAAVASARELLRAVPPPPPPPDLLPTIRAAADAEMLGEAPAIVLLHAVPAPEPPPDLLPAIRTAAAAQMRRDRAVEAFWGRWRTSIAAAAVAAAVLAAVFVPRGHETMNEAGPTIHAVIPDTPTVAEAVAGPVEVAVESAPAPSESVSRATDRVAARRNVSGRAPELRLDRAEHAAPVTSAAQESPPAAAPPAPVAEPALAFAPPEARSVPSVVSPIAPGQPTNGTMLAMAPRTTPAEAPVVGEATQQPSALETELATGVVARMVVDNFVTEHLIESTPTLLAVVTDTPTAELGPVLAEDSEDNFGLCFTESMRRALSETHNQLP